MFMKIAFENTYQKPINDKKKIEPTNDTFQRKYLLFKSTTSTDKVRLKKTMFG